MSKFPRQMRGALALKTKTMTPAAVDAARRYSVNHGWTEDTIADLDRYLAEGLSASAIGKLMKKSRNAIIAKCHRLNLKMSHQATRGRPAQPKPPAPPPVKKIAVPDRTAWAKPREEPITIPLASTLMELNGHRCHWPIGDPGESRFGFCGRSKTGGGVYCSVHKEWSHKKVIDPEMARRQKLAFERLIKVMSR